MSTLVEISSDSESETWTLTARDNGGSLTQELEQSELPQEETLSFLTREDMDSELELLLL